MRLRFADCAFDADTREVFRDGQLRPVAPKAFALLELLIEQRPKAVSREDIHERLWPDVHVSQANLANLVVELRAALGDNARKPRILRTVPRFGYAFSGHARPDRPRREPSTGAAPRVPPDLGAARDRARPRREPDRPRSGRGRLDRRRLRSRAATRAIVIGDAGRDASRTSAARTEPRLRPRRSGRRSRLADQDAIEIGPASLMLSRLQANRLHAFPRSKERAPT